MKLQINGEQRDFADIPSPFTLSALVEKLGMKADRVAVELNLDIAPGPLARDYTQGRGQVGNRALCRRRLESGDASEIFKLLN